MDVSESNDISNAAISNQLKIFGFYIADYKFGIINAIVANNKCNLITVAVDDLFTRNENHEYTSQR